MHHQNSRVSLFFLCTVPWIGDVKNTLQTNNWRQFGIETLYSWRAGPREEAICPRSLAESEAQLETLLMNTGSWSRAHHSQPTLLPHTKTKP